MQGKHICWSMVQVRRAVLGAVLAASASALATPANYTWVPNGTNWSDANAWTTTGGNATWVDGNTANFATGGGTVTLTAPVSADTVAIATGGYSFTGSTLTLTNSTTAGTVSFTTSKSVDFYNNLIGPGNGTGNMYVSGLPSNSAAPILGLWGNNTIGTLTLTGGPVELKLNTLGNNSGDAVTIHSAGTGPIKVDGAASGSTITYDTSMHQSYYTLNNAIQLNTGTATSNFTLALGGGDNADSGTGIFSLIKFAGGISGNGSIMFTNDFFGGGGKGFAEVMGTNTYTGATIINENAVGGGVLIGNDNALPTTTTLQFGAASAGHTTKPVGSIDLNGYNQTVAGLSSDLGGSSAVGVVNNASANFQLAVNNGTNPYNANGNGATTTSTLTINNTSTAASFTFAAPIRDGATGDKIALTLASTNKATEIFTATSDYSGDTKILGGTLYINGALAARTSGGPTSAVTVASGATLGGAGSIAGNVTINAGATLILGATTAIPGTLSLSSTVSGTTTTLNGGGTTFQIPFADAGTGAGAGWGLLNLAGSVVNNATTSSTITLKLTGALANFDNARSQDFLIANNIGVTNTADFGLINSITGVSTSSFSTLISGGNLYVHYTAPNGVQDFNWAGASGSLAIADSGTWTTNATVSTWIDTNSTSNSATNYIDAKNVIFGTPSGTGSTVTISGSVSPSYVNFTNASGHTYTLTSDGTGSLNGTVSVAVSGGGAVVMQNANGYTGGTNVSNNSVLETQINGALGTGSVNLLAGTWRVTGSAQTYSNNVAVSAGSVESAIDTQANLTLSGSITGAAPFAKNGSGTLTLSNTASAFSASGKSPLTQLDINAGKLIVNGPMTASSSTLKLNIASGAVLRLMQGTSNPASVTPYTLYPATSTSIAGNIEIGAASVVALGGFGSATTTTWGGGGMIKVEASETYVFGKNVGTGAAEIDITNPIWANSTAGVNDPAGNFNFHFGGNGGGNSLFMYAPISGAANVIIEQPGGGGAMIVHLMAASTYTGATIINTGQTQNTQLGVNNAIPITSRLIMGNRANGGTNSGGVDLNSFDQQVFSLENGTGSTSNATSTGITCSIPGIHTANNGGFLVSNFTVAGVGSSRVDLQACKLEYSIVSPK